MLDIKESVNALISDASSNNAYSYFEITLSSLVGVINKFVQIEQAEILDRNFEEMRKLVGQFESIKKNFDKNLQSGQYTLSGQEKAMLSMFFGPLEYVLRRLGRVISMFMVLA
jgi:hypothetical protein